jgi:arylsulfatase A-like enzyme
MCPARALAALTLAAALLAPSCSSGTGRRTSIVLVVWDTCRGDRVSVNGYPRPTSPRLDALAKEGTTFRRCFTPAPWTPPAHASLFTGLLPRDHGVRQGTGGERVNPGVPLLAETLKGAGYETVCITANGMVSGINGLTDGFETVVRVLRTDDPRGTGQDARDRVKAWLDGRRTSGERRPFFLFVNLMECHQPYVVETSAVAATRGDAAVNGARRAAELVTMKRTSAHLFGGEPVDAATLADLGAAYDGSILLDDRWTGEILDLLGDAGLREGTFVAVTSDHGENLGEHGELSHLMSVYEPVLHVPLVVRWPGRVEGGRVEDAEVRLQDLYPTILEAARVAVPPRCGKDAASLLESPLRPRTLVAEHGPNANALPEARLALPAAPAEVFDRFAFVYRAVREPASVPGARKYVQVLRPVEGGRPVLVREELYDLAADPGELRNLLPAERAAADRLRAVGER